MSDPVTNAEVEDVLSSIRRLVSEDKRPLQGSNPSPAADRLVLTPALRVAEPQETAAQATEAEPAEDATQADGHAAGAEESAADEVWDKPADDPAQDYSDDPYNFDDDADEDGEGAFGDAEASHDDDEAGAVEPSHPDDDELSQLLLHDRAEPEDAPDRPEQDAPMVDEAPMVLNAEDSPESLDNVEQIQPASKAAVLSAKIEELEAAIGNIADTWEPDGASGDAYAGTEAPAMAWEDDSQNSDEPAAAHLFKDAPEKDAQRQNDFSKVASAFNSDARATVESAPEEPQGSSAADYALDEQLIDEEMLRDLVSEIVRAELQGALGERITRNVRKLVRREIHRALTAQDLE